MGPICRLFFLLGLALVATSAKAEDKSCVLSAIVWEQTSELKSPDGHLKIKNERLDDGGTYQHVRSSYEWRAQGEVKTWVFDSLEDGSGWVENIGQIDVARGRAYLVVSELKLATAEFRLTIDAYVVKEGSGRLVPAEGFFQSVPGVNSTGSTMAWRYSRKRGRSTDDRPLEVRFGTSGDRICFWVATEQKSKLGKSKRTYSLPFVLRAGRTGLDAPVLTPALRKALTRLADE